MELQTDCMLGPLYYIQQASRLTLLLHWLLRIRTPTALESINVLTECKTSVCIGHEAPTCAQKDTAVAAEHQ